MQNSDDQDDYNETEWQRWIDRLDDLQEALRDRQAGLIEFHLLGMVTAYNGHAETPGIVDASLDDLVACCGPYQAARSLYAIGSRLHGRLDRLGVQRPQYEEILEKIVSLLAPQLDALAGPYPLKVVALSGKSAQWVKDGSALQERLAWRMLHSASASIGDDKRSPHTAAVLGFVEASCAFAGKVPLDREIGEKWLAMMMTIERKVMERAPDFAGAYRTSDDEFIGREMSVEALLSLAVTSARWWEENGHMALADKAAERWTVYINSLAIHKPMAALEAARTVRDLEAARRLAGSKSLGQWSASLENAAGKIVEELEKKRYRSLGPGRKFTP